MFAVIETGGKQYKVTEGDVLYIEKLTAEAGEAVTFDKVLAVLDGDTATFGAPTVEGASVTANVVKNCKNPELAQLFEEYLISKDTHDKIAEVMIEAPVI